MSWLYVGVCTARFYGGDTPKVLRRLLDARDDLLPRTQKLEVVWNATRAIIIERTPLHDPQPERAKPKGEQLPYFALDIIRLLDLDHQHIALLLIQRRLFLENRLHLLNHLVHRDPRIHLLR